MKTRITELFGIKHPIILAGMNVVTEPKMVSAVSNAGGLGILAIAAYTPDEARKAIREIKTLTNKPFGINQVLTSPIARENIAVAIEEKVPVINYSLGRPWFIEQVHEYGGKVLATVALVRHAVRAEQFGADAIQTTGHEAAAHGAAATTLILIPIVASSVKIPVTAAGGFFDGRGLAAALLLGCEGITMGTRFAITKESSLHEHWKQIILKATEEDTIYLDYGDPAANSRVLRTKRAEAEMKNKFPLISGIAGVMETKQMLKLSWGELIRAGLKKKETEEGFSMLQRIRYAASSAIRRRVWIDGDENAGVLPIGQSIGGISDILTVAEVIERTVAEAEEALKSVSRRVLV